MFYMLMYPLITYSYAMMAAAVMPALFLMIKVYQSDKLEKESPVLIRSLIIAGILSALLALVEETVFINILNAYLQPNTLMYQLILYFGVVAISEESSKYIMMRRQTWKNPEFNCQYDGVVYATVTSLGFALWENLKYVFSYGFGTAILRAVTAIPGHACFGVFMGVFYGIAKKYQYRGNTAASVFFRFLAIIVPVAIHGAYDFIATNTGESDTWIFFAFIAVLFIISYFLVGYNSRNDRYIDEPEYKIDN